MRLLESLGGEVKAELEWWAVCELYLKKGKLKRCKMYMVVSHGVRNSGAALASLSGVGKQRDVCDVYG